MNWWNITLTIVVSYLLGSVNCSILVSRLFLRVDIRDYGSGNAGSTNAFRVMGKKWAVPVVSGDFLKGVLAVLFGQWLVAGTGEESLARLLAGLCVILGHIFPVYFNFRGGKGVMTTAAIIAVVDWRVFIIVLSVFAVTVLITRWVSLGSILGALGIPVGMYFFYQGQGRETLIHVLLSAVISLVVIIVHRENIGRILGGTERRFSFKGRAVLDTIKTKTIDMKDKTATKLKATTHSIKARAKRLSNRPKKSKKARRKKYAAQKARRGNQKPRHSRQKTRRRKNRVVRRPA